MEGLLWIALGVIVKKLTELAMDALISRWRRRRRTPLTVLQVRRQHAIQFGIAVFANLYMAIIAVIFLVGGWGARDWFGCTVGVVALIAGWLFGRSALRRWRRYREARRAT